MFMISHVNVVETFEGKHLVIYYKHCVKRLTHSILLTHFNPMLSFSTPETSENQSFSDVFMGYRNGTLGQNGLRKTKVLQYSEATEAQPTFTSSKLAIMMLEKGVKYVQNEQ